jgi:hypothetical protein
VSDQGSTTLQGCASIGMPPAAAQPVATLRWIRPVWDRIQSLWGQVVCRFCGLRALFVNPFSLKGAT